MIYRSGRLTTTGVIRASWTIGGLIRICVDTVLDADSIYIRPPRMARTAGRHRQGHR
jgi:hypothetical protein